MQDAPGSRGQTVEARPRRSATPEVLAATAQDAAAQGENGVGSVLGPAQAGLFHASADHILVASFHHAGTDLQVLCMEVRVAPAVAVVLQIVGAHGGQFAAAA